MGEVIDATPVERWLGAARITDDPAGDLIADMRRDLRDRPHEFPRLFANIGEMRDHLRKRMACKEALAVVPAVWRRYRGWLGRHPFSSDAPEDRRNR